MKKIYIIIFIFIAANLFAKNSNFKLLADAGIDLSFLPEENRFYWPFGLHTGAGISYTLNENIALNFKFSFSEHNQYKEKYLISLGRYRKYGNVSAQYFSVNFQYFTLPHNNMIHPYVLSGLGYHKMVYRNYDHEGLLINLGLGFETPLNDSIGFYLENEFHFGFSKIKNTLNFPLKAGFSYRF